MRSAYGVVTPESEGHMTVAAALGAAIAMARLRGCDPAESDASGNVVPKQGVCPPAVHRRGCLAESTGAPTIASS
jgi:hypothetical protein